MSFRSILTGIPNTAPPDNVTPIKHQSLDKIEADILAETGTMVDIEAEMHRLEMEYVECAKRRHALQLRMGERTQRCGLKTEVPPPAGEKREG